jgi:hypothetical protein
MVKKDSCDALELAGIAVVALIGIAKLVCRC